MNKDFSRILILLRKERGISQKKAAEQFGVSQALLSHYEKGIRECGLDFVVKIADYYDVSVDYLLGRSPEKNGSVLNMEDLPDENLMGKENVMKGSILPTLNKRLLVNSLNIIFTLLQEVNNKDLTTDVSLYLSLAVYRMFRHIYSIDGRSPETMFAVDNACYGDMSTAQMALADMRVKCMAGDGSKDIRRIEYVRENLLTPELLTEMFPLFATSLSNVIYNCEQRMGVRKQKD